MYILSSASLVFCVTVLGKTFRFLTVDGKLLKFSVVMNKVSANCLFPEVITQSFPNLFLTDYSLVIRNILDYFDETSVILLLVKLY